MKRIIRAFGPITCIIKKISTDRYQRKVNQKTRIIDEIILDDGRRKLARLLGQDSVRRQCVFQPL